ncbi:MAG: MmcB family DNA repair protein [Tistlia sp.]|uniref:MmcB family DNA repair protein n=1 Tax=Tistlia sp. TaxID=3057121 RepID=UPI0034A0DB8E
MGPESLARAGDALADDPAALRVARGVCRLFDRLGHVGLTEFVLRGGRRADVLALGPGGELSIVEIKSCLADFRSDGKWPQYLEFCERYYFAVPLGFPLEVLPEDQGLIVADGYDAAILREADRRPIAAARRKAVTLRFGQVAARRLRLLLDPEGVGPGFAG